jgi:D-methionine transport system substrate-binding protein
MKIVITLCALTIWFLLGCQNQEKILRVAATPVPHAEMLEAIQSDMKEKGIRLEIIEVDDYNLPNRLLQEKQVDANFFQHEPFLKIQEKEFGYSFAILARIHIEPLGVYSKKIQSLSQIRQKATVAIPSDPSNEARALRLLEEEGLIRLHENVTLLATPLDIVDNPKKLHFQELDAALLAHVLPDVDLAVIPANFALQAGLCPQRSSLLLESGESPYANLLVVRKGDENRPELQLLAQILTSEKMRNFMCSHYKGSLIPSFKK